MQSTELTGKQSVTATGDAKQDLARAIRAIGFLLDWSAQDGNSPVHGIAANGLARLLEECAQGTARLYTRDELAAAGGDHRKLQASRRRAA